MTGGGPSHPAPWWRLLRTAAYAAVLLGLGEALLFHLRDGDAWDVFDEYGHVEMTQLALLGLGVVLGLVAALVYPRSRPTSFLVVGLLVAVLVREHNNYFKDHVGRGVWQAVVAGVVVVTLGISAFWWRRAVSSVGEFTRTPAFAWMAAALMLVAFGQLMDEADLWAFMLEGTDPKAARRAVEECFELVGIYLFTVGVFEWVLTLRAAREAP